MRVLRKKFNFRGRGHLLGSKSHPWSSAKQVEKLIDIMGVLEKKKINFGGTLDYRSILII